MTLRGNEESRVFYSSAQWKKLARQVRKLWKAQGLPCGYCGQPLTNGRLIVDHIINRRKRPDLAFSLDNLTVVHHACNTKKYHHVEVNNKPKIGYDGLPDDWR